MSDTIKEMKAIADEMKALAESERSADQYDQLVEQYNDVLAKGKKLAAHIVKTDEEMEILKAENTKLRERRTELHDLVENLEDQRTELQTQSKRLANELGRICSASKCDGGVTFAAYRDMVDQWSILKAENKNIREAIAERITKEEGKNTKLKAENERLNSLLPTLAGYPCPGAIREIRKSVLAEVRERVSSMVGFKDDILHIIDALEG